MEIEVEKKVLAANDQGADEIRALLAEHGVFMLNVMSSPGSGKTTALQRTLDALMPGIACAVVVGDICSTHDADRLAKSGAPVVQINTDQFGGDCHLGAHLILAVLKDMDLDAVDLLIVENVGNLVCPAEFDIGEHARVVVLSVTEGEDKPIKYPLMFRVCDAMLLNKVDLLPHLDYDAELAVRNVHAVHPGMPVFRVSATTGEGFEGWLDWLRERCAGRAG